MFGNKTTKSSFSGASTTLISKNTEIVGDVHFSGTLMIEGRIKGNVSAADGTEAEARVLESGKVEGEIRVPSLVINGTVSGDVFSSKYVELAAKTVINGNVHYSLIEVVKGAQVNGNLVYSESQKAQNAAPSKPVAIAPVADATSAADKSDKKHIQ